MTTLMILGGMLAGAGVIAALFRARSSRSETPLHLGVGKPVHQTRGEGRR
jgi:hypothetical protein